MSSFVSKDHASLCLFTFTDGRRCRTPRSGAHPHFCFYHAQKESQSQLNAKLAGDLSSLFSRDYVSACDLSAALGRLLVAVARGGVKPKAATTIASLARTLAQTIRLAQHEYINAFGTDGWRQAVCDSVNQNFGHLNRRSPNSGDPDEPSDACDSDDTGDPTDPEPSDGADDSDIAVPIDREDSDAEATEAAQGSDDPAETEVLTDAEAPHAADDSADPGVPEASPEETHQTAPNECVSDAAESQPTEPATPPTPVEEALTVARNLFPRRRSNTAPTNPFKINIYNNPRND